MWTIKHEKCQWCVIIFILIKSVTQQKRIRFHFRHVNTRPVDTYSCILIGIILHELTISIIVFDTWNYFRYAMFNSLISEFSYSDHNIIISLLILFSEKHSIKYVVNIKPCIIFLDFNFFFFLNQNLMFDRPCKVLPLSERRKKRKWKHSNSLYEWKTYVLCFTYYLIFVGIHGPYRLAKAYLK